MTECENDEMTGDKGSVAEKIPAVEPLFFFRAVMSLYRRGPFLSARSSARDRGLGIRPFDDTVRWNIHHPSFRAETIVTGFLCTKMLFLSDLPVSFCSVSETDAM